VSHLHVPDGLLPWPLWAAGLLLALLLLARASHLSRGQSPQRIAYQGALGGLMLAAMAIPLGPLDLHVTAIGPVGVLLGAAGAFQVVFVVSIILALMGHGGLTVIGLNTLILGAGAAVAALVYRPLASRLSPAWSLAAGAALGQIVTGVLWLAVVGLGMRLVGLAHAGADAGAPAGVHAGPHAAALGGGAWGGAAARTRFEMFAAFSLPWWIAGLVVESTIAFGLGRFLARVQPDLLPGARMAPIAAPAGRSG
jgi:cobalt/nickel transport system permease protein